MARMTKTQIAKLSPAERKEREKQLKYKREYHAKRKAERENTLNYKKQYHARKNAEKLVSQTVIERAEVLLAELKVTEAKRDSIVKELRETFLK